jgi:hypothetical protein
MRVVSRSRNLRGILEYSRTHFVARIDLYKHDLEGQLGITWANGSTVITSFASFDVMQRWVKRPLFKGVNIRIHGGGQ